MKKTLFLILALCITGPLWSQSKGDELVAKGNLVGAMYAYGAEFMSDPTDTDKAYQLVTTLSLVNEVDTAFYFLNIALQDDYTLRPLVDSKLFNLSNDPRWEGIAQRQITKYQEKRGAMKNPDLALRLMKIIMRDQALDFHMHMSRNEYQEKGFAPHWVYAIGMQKNKLNQGNYKEMQAIVKTHGWPTYDMVGDLAADALLLVVNHHPDAEVRKQYLPQIKAACEAGQGSCMEYAKIHDRILVDEGKEQLYGMQFRYNKERKLEPFPIEKPEKVDKRRKAIGLEPLAEYLKRKIDYDWKVEQR